ncbi:MAG: DUF1850 domain-containing protein [Firmicutes bacterium]|nr:DUF1850 domain-containing protein [Bacillota bacterium]
MKRFLTGAAVVVIIASSVFIYNIFWAPSLVLSDGNTGKTFAVYPVNEGDEFSVTFVHSVNKSPVTDVYQIRNGAIYVSRTIYYSFGAGVQTRLEPGQTLEYGGDGSMIVSGFQRRLDNLSYIVGTVSDHILKIGGESVSLRDLCGRNATVRFYYGSKFLIIWRAKFRSFSGSFLNRL